MAQILEVRPGRHLSVFTSVPDGDYSETIFFIHGAGGRKAQWSNQIKHFAKRYKIVSFDFPGHGQSPETTWGEYHYKKIVDDFLILFNRHKSKSNIIVAHSMGTAVTMHTLLELKRLELISSVKKVVLIGARGLERPVSTFLLAYTPTFVLKMVRPLISNAFKKASWHDNTPMDLIMSEKEQADNNSMYMIKAFVSQMQWPLKSQFEEIASVTSLKVLMITGETDGITSVVGARLVADWLKPVLDQDLLVVPKSSHMVMLEQPDVVNEAIDKFITDK
jgi:pimeloyl-ACP methyl ester carboxylesterase